MSHLVETMFYVGAVPWHGLGDKLDAPPTCAEAISQAGLDWSVEACPVFAQRQLYGEDHRQVLADDSFEKLPEAQVVRRCTDGSVLGVVGPRWRPVQNKDAFNFFDPMVQAGEAILHTAGSLNGGKTVWILAQIGETRSIIGDDHVGQFLLLSMGHDGKRAVQVMPTPIRVVCANTLGFAERGAEGGKTMVKISHTANAVRRLNQVGDFIRPHLKNFDEAMQVFQLLAKANVTSQAADAYLRTLFPDPKDPDSNAAFAQRVRREILAKFEGDLLGYDAIPGQFKNTWWTLYNAVTEYVDHDRGTDRARMNSAWFGSGASIKAEALDLAHAALVS